MNKQRSEITKITKPDNGNILYLVMAAAGFSIGISIFLYREIKKIKANLAKQIKTRNEIMNQNQQEINENFNIMSQNMKVFEKYIVDKKKTPPTKNTKIELDEEDDDVVVVLEGGPPSIDENYDSVKMDSDDSDDEECDEGVCIIPQKKKKKKIFKIV